MASLPRRMPPGPRAGGLLVPLSGGAFPNLISTAINTPPPPTMSHAMSTSESIDGYPYTTYLGGPRLSVAVVHNDTMDVDNSYNDGLSNDLQELFPVDEEEEIFSTPLGRVNEPTASAWAIDPCDDGKRLACPAAAPCRGFQSQAKKPTRHRKRIRKRTDQQKKSENAKRHAQWIEFQVRRADCFARERRVRAYVREWIHGYAEAIGHGAVDETILPFLPVELREIMARSEAAIAAYANFSGQTNLREALNGFPNWW